MDYRKLANDVTAALAADGIKDTDIQVGTDGSILDYGDNVGGWDGPDDWSVSVDCGATHYVCVDGKVYKQ